MLPTIFNDMDGLQNINPDDLNKLVQVLMSQQITNVQKAMTELKSIQDKQQKEISEIREMQVKSNEYNKMLDQKLASGLYAPAMELGKQFRFILSAQSVNKLIIWAGLAYKEEYWENNKPKTRVTPYAEFRNAEKNPIVHTVVYPNSDHDVQFMSFYWHKERTLNYIKKKMEKLGLWGTFMGCETKAEADRFINSLGKSHSSSNDEYFGGIYS